jgi:hypothetical protein
VVAIDAVGLPLHDPDYAAAQYLGLVGLGVAMVVAMEGYCERVPRSRVVRQARSGRAAPHAAGAGSRNERN